MASFKAKFPVLQELFAKNHRGALWAPPSGARVNIVTFPRSTEVIRSQLTLMTSYAIFRVFVPTGVIWCADFEFGIRLPFPCVEMGTLES